MEGVEREPMWDGNVIAISDAYRSAVLSENQCGMETSFPTRTLYRVPSLSENQCGMETRTRPRWSYLSRVEREPMWDGNEFSFRK